MPRDALAAEILDFARDATAGDFGDLALALFARQFAILPAYRAHCESLDASPATVVRWTDIPAVDAPGSAESDEGRESIGLESSDSGRAQELFRLALPELFDPQRLRLIVGSAAGTEAQTLLLDALGSEAPGGSLVARDRLDAKELRSWLGARQRDHQPVSLVSDPAGFARLGEVLERRAVKFRLPAGSEAHCVMPIEAAASAPPDSWSRPLPASLGLPPESCLRLLVGARVSTPLPERFGGSVPSFRLPHWVRTAPLAGGSLAIFDLASIDAPPRRLAAATELLFS